jgi:hypothetical protein
VRIAIIMKRILPAVVAAFALLAAAANAQQMHSKFGIKLYGCNVVQNGNSTDGVWVNYTNTRSMPATEVDFVVRYNGVVNTMTDVGKFSQYAQIQHTLHNALIGAAWNGQTPQNCRVSRVIWADGTVSR